jgi:hypothetical protein
MARPTTAVIDAIVLAFSKSRLKDVVGTDALKMVLAGITKEMLQKENTLSLQPVYELLESQPGFVHADAIPPLCRIKQWEPKLKLIVELPKELGLMPTEERERAAATCFVREEDIDKILVPRERSTIPPPLGARVVEGSSNAAQASKRGPDVTRRKMIAAAAFVVVAIAAMIVSYKLTFGSDSGNVRLANSQLSPEIPLTQVRQSGKMIGAVLADQAWLAKPEVERRRHLELALINAAALGARDIRVFDSKGKLLASAAMRASKPVVTFAR